VQHPHALPRSTSLPSVQPARLLLPRVRLWSVREWSSLYVHLPPLRLAGAHRVLAVLKNASLHLTTLVFLHLYPTSTPSILSTFLSLLRQYPSTVPSTTLLNPSTTDILLRLLHEISQEIGDAQLRLNKSPTRLAKDAELRDAVRIHDAVAIAATLYEIIGECLEGLGKPEGKVGLTGKAARELGEMAIRVVGDYVCEYIPECQEMGRALTGLAAWIDINLMITPTSIPLLLAALHLPSTADIGMRTATAEALTETVTKGMPAVDKLALLNVLDIGTVLGRLVDYGREGGKGKEDEKIEAFRTKLGGLLNGVGSELCRIADDVSPLPLSL
jgi:exportin-T